MAHKSREPERAVRGKLTRPHDRGERYVAPQILPEEAAGSAWSKDEAPAARSSRVLRHRKRAPGGEAHDLIRKLDAAILMELAKR